jgi:transcriptional regulator with XRE-family HTH domain
MAAIITDMTLREMLEERTDIRTPGALRAKIGSDEMSRQQAWLLWHGRTSLGLRTAKRIAQATGIPLEDLAEVDEAVPGRPRHRPEKPPTDPPS